MTPIPWKIKPMFLSLLFKALYEPYHVLQSNWSSALHQEWPPPLLTFCISDTEAQVSPAALLDSAISKQSYGLLDS